MCVCVCLSVSLSACLYVSPVRPPFCPHTQTCSILLFGRLTVSTSFSFLSAPSELLTHFISCRTSASTFSTLHVPIYSRSQSTLALSPVQPEPWPPEVNEPLTVHYHPVPSALTCEYHLSFPQPEIITGTLIAHPGSLLCHCFHCARRSCCQDLPFLASPSSRPLHLGCWPPMLATRGRCRLFRQTGIFGRLSIGH